MLTDFDIATPGQGGFAPTWSTPGPGTSEQQNSGLGNPLTDAGTFCLRMRGTITNAGDKIALGQQIFTIKNSVSSGVFANIPSTNKVTVTGWLRNAGDRSGGAEGQNVGLLVKGIVPGGNPPSEAFAGYKLRLGTIVGQNSVNENAFALRLSASLSDGSDGSATQVVCTGSYAPDTWYRVKFEVTPQLDGSDKLEAFTGTGATGSETWTSVGVLNVPSTASNYIAWGLSNTKIGFYAALCANSGAGPLNATSDLFIDAFSANVQSL